ncbi:HD domain-containing phosphohydrolase [Novispirillum sp. DQ9]|uniref:HD domain-containing phosphohydrolase n=1 Tax=Novispirillum sp. DQ9 TaxID=3398612 RepID=UPI003C7C83BA
MADFKLPFKVSIVSAILLIVAAITGTTLITVWVASSRAAEETARNLFSGVAQGVYERLDRQVGQTLRLAELGAVQTAIAPPAATDAADGADIPTLPFLFSGLANDSAFYSAYYGFADGTFLQVIAARQDPRIVAAHDAPAGTHWIVRTITGTAAERTQRWRFLDAAHRPLGERREEAPAFDPRTRPWYGTALDGGPARLSNAYVFNSLGLPGITASKGLPNGIGVFGADITLSGLETFLDAQSVSDNGGVALVDDQGRILAASSSLPGGRTAEPLAPISSLPGVAFQALDGLDSGTLRLVGPKDAPLMLQRLDWTGGGRDIAIVAAAPLEDFIGHIRAMQARILQLAAGAVVLFVGVALVVSGRLSRSVKALVADADRVRHLDFSGDPPRGSRVREFHDLGEALEHMKSALSDNTTALREAEDKLVRLIDLGIAMAAERDSDRLMELVLMGAKDLTNADGGTLYTVSDDDALLEFKILFNDSLGMRMGGTAGPITIPGVPLRGADGAPNRRNVVSHAVHQQETVNIADAYDATEFDFSGTRAFDERNGYRSRSFLTVPLKPRGGGVIGALQLINSRRPGTLEVVPFSPHIQRFVEALAAQAATALYNRSLLDSQERMMDGMIHLLAGAIDAKSPYTGGHCERVPVLAEMLAKAACAVDDGPLGEFRFDTDAQWREFRIGAWLHDCGKVVTPEYVVDKATKLETIHNRIHEVRTRFEVLLRDARIACLEAIAAGTAPADAEAAFAATRAELLDDFAFIAECNIGGEFMAPQRVERLKAIARRTWVRHFDDRLGLSEGEMKRFSGPPAPLPATECLLDDKPHHVIPRQGGMHGGYDGFGFHVTVPENLYNFGEVYNLSIGRGTLTEEERFKITEHIMQTIAMLERLPYPKDLRRVPEYAGTHHETLGGTGYPRRLDKDALSVPARIMAIADIFEALTASDRPYKKIKTLSECVDILHGFKKRGDIDPNLFDLFLTSGVYRQYAARFLLPEQLDEVDITAYLTPEAAPV